MANTYDVIVLGVGGMGSAACFELARRGRRVLGLEQFPLVHARGSSHGHTRIIRTAYAEHPDYVPLVRRAFERWYELEQLTGRHLLTECPCLNVGPPGSEHVAGVRASVREHRLEAEELTAAEVVRRFPAFRFPADYAGVLERAAGFLYVEDCVRAHIDSAVSLGADIRAEEPVRSWEAVGGGVRVTTDRGTYSAAKLVVTAGAWATRLLADVGDGLKVMRQTLLWFDAGPRRAEFTRDRFPLFICDAPGAPFYGFPAIDPHGLKIARHYGQPELSDPDGVDWDVTADDASAIRPLMDAHIPGLGALMKGQVCMYTVSPDHHFVIDSHPAHPQVSVACGFSGHGFKFASAVGEVLADLADSGTTRHGIGLFRATRFGNAECGTRSAE
ncbi:methyltryptophan oxidase : Sarcosine oxidase OS=Sphaerobacter thermophilus (strain DSM 20745 / S 6022) GN=Sthe_0190 PE=4 SV=1: DAO [Gemmataceae bacterium]|nr:methyltryptophan oxidase : Sarcosine oxidase OS=Sphaerobacter thermophilus (strain DSM 20745 / S 6022) GN=Sthe_0190 PE=4 SV=1: DAO [Gemmataceae bacterium]VTT97963.1 methyltryptophan oxidase : Sarcosine oxidase OS=Sphaerobacter thermophilus (strain DSM 20745 / S 6022) GN=Sthe_0190 PE=4 SV=1: DAO [Gemmataceae bacterium]